MKYLVFLMIVVLAATTSVISRNQKIESMLQHRKVAVELYNKLILEAEQTIQSNLEMCMKTTKDTGCSSIKMWQHQRERFSKNITNLQEKIVKHEATVKNILEVNQKEALRKMLIISKLLPKLIKVKNDIEFIEGLQFIIEDSYLNIEVGKNSIFQLFNTETSLIQLSQRKDPGAKPITPEHLPNPMKDLPQPKQQYNQGPPLIDEKIFDGHAEQFPRVDAKPLFDSEEGKVPAPLSPDVIPDGVNVKQHDDGVGHAEKYGKMVEGYLTAKEGGKIENTMVGELEKGFKHRIKTLGWQMHTKFEEMLKKLNEEQDQLTQAVADLERAIYTMHHQHQQQIVQIYLENKKIQREIYEKDDRILWLDSKVHDCQNMAEKLNECEQARIVEEHFVADIRAQKDLNEGVINELKRLSNYPDKNVEAPNGIPPEVPKPAIQADIEQVIANEEDIASIESPQVEQPVTAEPVSAEPVSTEPAVEQPLQVVEQVTEPVVEQPAPEQEEQPAKPDLEEQQQFLLNQKHQKQRI